MSLVALYSLETRMPTADLDPAPPEVPDDAAWEEALQKGLGRALMWAKAGDRPPVPLLLHACLNDLRYDRQCEDSRGPWLWEILQAAGLAEEVREPVLDALGRIDDGLAAQQLCQFAVRLARLGDTRFREALHQVVAEKPDPQFPSL